MHNVHQLTKQTKFVYVPHILDISKRSIHDAKLMENIITNKLKENKMPLNIIGDKGYIKNCEYINTIKDAYNINHTTTK